MAEWLQIRCCECRGYGVVSDYGFTGYEFHGAKECDVCGGSGHQWISNGDRLADYPGGPLRGSDPGRFEREKMRTK